ncbi:MAG: protein phosphatase 2C domain-containing protein [Muribaculaceae bacterium]|nr:protein phosphatase 2C domain-containing protein [Muribaculaceae bacterium]
MKLKCEALSHIGLRRKLNQDMAVAGESVIRDDSCNSLTDIPEDGFKFGAVVCDGLGGHSRGEVASEMACKAFRNFLDSLPATLDDNELLMEVKRWFKEINYSIMAASPGELMCTTLTGILFYGETALILNAGDSRTYRRRFGEVIQLTADHSERERTGDLSVPASRIYNCLGLPEAFLDVKLTRIVEGDSFLICSDGLSGMIPEEELKENFSDPARLLDLALKAGGDDNVTLICIDILE